MEGTGSLGGLSTGIISRREELNRPDQQQIGNSEEKLKKACADFESIFIGYMLKTMRSTVPKSGSNFPGKDIYDSIVDHKVAENLTKRGGGIGLQEMLLRHLGKPGIMDQKPAIKDRKE